MAVSYQTNDTTQKEIDKIEMIDEVLHLTYNNACDLLLRLEGMQWEGEHFDHIKAMLKMVVRYHKDIKTVNKELINTLKGHKQRYESIEDLQTYVLLKGMKL